MELAKFHQPKVIHPEPKDASANTLGIRLIMFAVDDIEDVIARLCTHGAELVVGCTGTPSSPARAATVITMNATVVTAKIDRPR